eukprot:CAMPEP_0182877446 /NCGR_PEP_ID=MMETSP0034_2-20130328/14754_1 /TAXON_ID=156128 /ORGANISM="Nephroselmis pyriformis, Strain CCMP717" /LENGTH=485 /DNA_ID=CAMNT_0025010287 /DNA_START=283 /DNA_END=1740 /DNA_ORIENTATION=-
MGGGAPARWLGLSLRPLLRRGTAPACSPAPALRPHQRGLATSGADLPPPLQVPQRRVVVTGIGMVTPLGVGTDLVWSRLVAGESGVRKLTLDDFEGGDAVLQQLPAQIAGRVAQGVAPGEFDFAEWVGLSHGDPRHLADFVKFALGAAGQAMDMAGWKPSTDEEKDRTGVAIGAGIGSVGDMADAGVLKHEGRLRRLSPFFIPKVLINMAAGHISIKYGLRGPNHAAVTACASGAHSIGDAFRFIRSGDADVMVAGGAEACIDPVSIAGFCRLKALASKFNDDPQGASRPFDSSRAGFVIGEGAAVMVLEEMEHARRRGAVPLAEVRGYGLSGDAYHITQPSKDAKGATLAMERALASSGIDKDLVGYINAHATSTPIGDEVELTGINKVFGERAARGGLAVSSTKGATGHLLGAAGAVEAAFTVLALRHGVLPPTLNLHTPDSAYVGMNLVPREAQEADIVAAASNSFGFGGTNTSLLFSKPPW